MRHVATLSYNVQLGRGNVQRVHIRRQSHVGLLGPVGPDERVDLDAVDVVHVLQSSSDLRLGRSWTGQPLVPTVRGCLLDIDDEYQSVVLLNLLHRAFGVEGEHKDAGRIQAHLILQPGSASQHPGRVTRLTETDLRWYFGFRARDRVFGRWKLVVKRTLWTLCELTYIENRPQQSALNATHMKAKWDVFTPLRAAFAAASALPFFSAAPLPADLAAAVLQSVQPAATTRETHAFPLTRPLAPLYVGRLAVVDWRGKARWYEGGQFSETMRFVFPVGLMKLNFVPGWCAQELSALAHFRASVSPYR
jgi:hypothetical protein